MKGKGRRPTVPGQLQIKMHNPIWKMTKVGIKKKKKRLRPFTQVVVCLCSKCKTLSSNSNTAKNKRKQRERFLKVNITV
jgi:hypothetical protein